MKSILSLSILSLSLLASAHAGEKTLLDCTTRGDALDYVVLTTAGEEKGAITIGFMSEATVTYTVTGSMKAVAEGKATTLIGTRPTSNEFGGGISDAALFTVLEGQSEAILAADGLVYSLTCRKN